MDAASRRDKAKQKETSVRGDRAKPKSAQQELKQRQRAEGSAGYRMHQTARVRMRIPNKVANLRPEQSHDRTRAAAV
ncbi:small vasohibin-binding protein isoform X1 [Neoarius graeffei]|uniref:small vasohibin-binding protein isoform X1 n=1 Tax=Neoarius graeffei TaxID=443677 RepID=UPI00298C2FB5|nr:small vasohibin-binding protein isoform X1 [Neoarius graeffei]XP_060766720.1 small vasohibin-binding protein isoform X1 [Neoarius graeffei]XP_060766721.1 small vasohibin-binding protein isoform X1 [Neoarius graeffei]XP_060766722.1 small vasohibin-binding protein isoform X1 [Neoarius graeffei]XP_060766723.1 small vasohibin-binding protein isoform X1 [Neoarius graeffei]